MRVSCLLFLGFLFYFQPEAQMIVQKNDRFGIIDERSGDFILPLGFDTIFALPFDKHISNSNQFISESPLFACKKNDSIQIYNAYNHSFYPGFYDEIRFTEAIEEQIQPFPKSYNPNHIDCIMLRRGALWGYIGHAKSYGFHDALLKSDVFNIIEPNYTFLRFIEEDVYSSQEYKRRNRMVVAGIDSLYGALSFEKGEVLVPIIYPVPIAVYSNAYNRRGLEFLSTKGGFIPYFIAREHFDAKEQIIINAQGTNASFRIDYPFTKEIYQEEGEDLLYVFSKERVPSTLSIWNYNTGEKRLSYVCDSNFTIEGTRREAEVLWIFSYNRASSRSLLIGYNMYSKKLVLSHEFKRTSYYPYRFSIEYRDGIRQMVNRKSKKVIATLEGNGAEMGVLWKKKVYLRPRDQ